MIFWAWTSLNCQALQRLLRLKIEYEYGATIAFLAVHIDDSKEAATAAGDLQPPVTVIWYAGAPVKAQAVTWDAQMKVLLATLALTLTSFQIAAA